MWQFGSLVVRAMDLQLMVMNRDIAIFGFFKMAAAVILDFKNF